MRPHSWTAAVTGVIVGMVLDGENRRVRKEGFGYRFLFPCQSTSDLLAGGLEGAWSGPLVRE